MNDDLQIGLILSGCTYPVLSLLWSFFKTKRCLQDSDIHIGVNGIELYSHNSENYSSFLYPSIFRKVMPWKFSYSYFISRNETFVDWRTTCRPTEIKYLSTCNQLENFLREHNINDTPLVHLPVKARIFENHSIMHSHPSIKKFFTSSKELKMELFDKNTLPGTFPIAIVSFLTSLYILATEE